MIVVFLSVDEFAALDVFEEVFEGWSIFEGESHFLFVVEVVTVDFVVEVLEGCSDFEEFLVFFVDELAVLGFYAVD